MIKEESDKNSGSNGRYRSRFFLIGRVRKPAGLPWGPVFAAPDIPQLGKFSGKVCDGTYAHSAGNFLKIYIDDRPLPGKFSLKRFGRGL